MIRTLLVPEQQSISIQLPASYVGKSIEVIAFEVGESEHDTEVHPVHDFAGFYDKIEIDLSAYKFDRNEANER